MTKAGVLEMIDRAKWVKIGVKGPGGTVYFNVSTDVAREKADEIAGFGLLVEFDCENGTADTLYIEAV